MRVGDELIKQNPIIMHPYPDLFATTKYADNNNKKLFFSFISYIPTKLNKEACFCVVVWIFHQLQNNHGG